MSEQLSEEKPKTYSEKAVNALIKRNALNKAAPHYIIPMPGANDDDFLRDAKAMIGQCLDKIIENPNINIKEVQEYY